MNVLMYPIAPDDDFPDEFCAIRQGSGEHWFYTPVGEDASWMLFRAESENAKLRELVRWMYDRMDESCAVQHPYAPAPISYDRLMQANARACELGVEVEQ